jgi:hypothetical protein
MKCAGDTKRAPRTARASSSRLPGLALHTHVVNGQPTASSQSLTSQHAKGKSFLESVAKMARSGTRRELRSFGRCTRRTLRDCRYGENTDARSLGLAIRGPRIHQLAALFQRLTSTVGSASGSIDRSLLNHLKESLFDQPSHKYHSATVI